jgi:transcriptional regulator with XRE-family HTH domain
MALRISEVLMEHEMTITELVNRMNQMSRENGEKEITRSSLQQTIKGRQTSSGLIEPNPTYKVLQRIADAIPCHITELFDQPEGYKQHEITRIQIAKLDKSLHYIQSEVETIKREFGLIEG